MMRKVRAYLDLVRLPNLFTSVADIIAGFAFGGGDLADWSVLARLAASSVCLYAGGVTLNDVCDARDDAEQRPGRPIPSGRVSLRSAQRLAVVLLIAGVALAVWASVGSGVVAVALCICIVLYDGPLKRSIVAPGLMGLCRSLNFSLPLAALEPAGWAPLLPIAAVWMYATSLTQFARRETDGGHRGALTAGTMGLCLSALALAGLHWTIPEPHEAYMVGVALLVVALAFFGVRAVRCPKPTHVQRAVSTFVVLLIALDVCIAWASRGGEWAAAIATLFIPVLILGSRRVALRIT